MKIIFAGGGTGGHLFSGVALAEALEENEKNTPQKTEILFVGTPYGLEKEIIPREGYRLEMLSVKPLKGRGLWQRLKNLAEIPRALLQSYRLLKKERPALVFGIGGYASGPVTLLARFLGIRTAILEQNSMPGLTNRILGRFVHQVFLAFDNARKFFPSRKIHLTGNPLRQSFLRNLTERTVSRSEDNSAFRSTTLLILGGSQGARPLNEAVVAAAEILQKEGLALRIVHQAGKADVERVRQEYQQGGIGAEVLDFVRDIQKFYREADLVIARSGAGTVTELQVMGKPAIFVPYPFAADDHQRINALELVQAGGAKMILQPELTAERLAREIRSLLENRERLKQMGEASLAIAKPKAAEEILRLCLPPPMEDR